MNKEIFLERLAELLRDIPEEEREEALEFYRNYFEEAGEEREADVLRELGSPERAAGQIKDGLAGKEPEEYGDAGWKNWNGSMNTYPGKKGSKKTGKILLLICLIILALPVGIPVFLLISMLGVAVLGLVLSAGVTVFALTFAGLLTGGICMAAGVMNLGSAPSGGILLCGIGFLSLAVGILLLMLSVWVVGKIFPWIFEKIRGLWNRVFRKKGESLS
jgi:uncharacterized membrane protein